MSVRVALAMCGLLVGLTPIAAQPKILPGDMAGRERERFIDNPNERFMRSGPYLDPPVVRLPSEPRKSRVRRDQAKKR